MSAPTSPNLPRSDQSSVNLFGFEGAEELWQSWRDGLTPDPLLTVSEWADKHRFLSPRASAELVTRISNLDSCRTMACTSAGSTCHPSLGFTLMMG